MRALTVETHKGKVSWKKHFFFVWYVIVTASRTFPNKLKFFDVLKGAN